MSRLTRPHQLCRGDHAGIDRQSRIARGGGDSVVEAGRHDELAARGDRAIRLVRVQHRTGADNSPIHLRGDRTQTIDRGVGAQNNLQNGQPACHQRVRNADGFVRVIALHERHDGGCFEAI